MNHKPVGYYAPPACRRHDMGAWHPESGQRLDAIQDHLLATGLFIGLQYQDAPSWSLDRLLVAMERVHGSAYVKQLVTWGTQWNHQTSLNPIALDADTFFGMATWPAIVAATSAVLEATHQVAQGHLGQAFCAVRPPGHHARPHQAMGFCFINHVAVAAYEALNTLGMKRVAIVDFDVHHGNGTEEMVAHDERLLMCSFYQSPFYPETPPLDAPNLVNIPVPAYTQGKQIREIVQQHWLPRLMAHQPEMIFISAGFDAHQEDTLGQMRLVEADFAWITQQLLNVANTCCHGRIVSSLEGGYDLSSLSRSVAAHLKIMAT